MNNCLLEAASISFVRILELLLVVVDVIPKAFICLTLLEDFLEILCSLGSRGLAPRLELTSIRVTQRGKEVGGCPVVVRLEEAISLQVGKPTIAPGSKNQGQRSIVWLRSQVPDRAYVRHR